MHFQQGLYEFDRLVVQKWVYAERIFAAAFIGMLVGTIVGWWSDRTAAALLMSGYVLVAVVPFMSNFGRPMLGADAQGIAIMLLPFFIVGILYGYAGRRPSMLI
jgi:hypothetical protein